MDRVAKELQHHREDPIVLFARRGEDLGHHLALRRQHGLTHVAHLSAQAGVRYSLSNPQSYIRENLQCFISLLETHRRFPTVRLVYASSSSVYGANTKTPFAEVDRVDSPNSLYAASKKANEAIAHVYHGLYRIPVPRACMCTCMFTCMCIACHMRRRGAPPRQNRSNRATPSTHSALKALTQSSQCDSQ